MVNKKGMSAVLATVIIIGLTVTAGALIWAVVNNLIGKNLEKSGTCFDVLDQVKLDTDYTCYNESSKIVQFSISVGDIDADGILIAVSFAGSSKSATLTNTSQTIENVKNYPSGSSGVKMPEKNSGATYLFEGITISPSSVSVIPIISGNQCGAADTLHNLDDCASLVS